MVACGGALGAVGRYLISHWVSLWTAGSVFPWGTLVVNVLGSALLGFLMALGVGEHGLISEHFRTLAAAGFLGAFTTFSTFSFETLEALRAGEPRLAFFNVALSLAAGLLACGLGWAVGSRL